MTEIYNSSRGVVFLWVIMIIITLVINIIKMVKGRFKLSQQKYAEKKPQASEEQIGGRQPDRVSDKGTELKPEPKKQVEQEPEQAIDKFIKQFEVFVFQYSPFLALALLNVVGYHSWAFNLVLLFLVVIPIIAINVMGVFGESDSACVSTATRYFWAIFTVAWFINYVST